jgi:hypothetical protein
MTTTAQQIDPFASDPEWTDICERVALIRDPNARDIAGDAVTDAYSLGMRRGVARATTPGPVQEDDTLEPFLSPHDPDADDVLDHI